MPISQFPTRYNAAHPSEPAADTHLILQDVTPERGISIQTFKDNGKSRGTESPNAVTLRWILIYDGESATDAAVYDAHYVESLEGLLPFSFRHPRTGILYTDVYYESFVYPQHEHLNSQRREITLIKSPA